MDDLTEKIEIIERVYRQVLGVNKLVGIIQESARKMGEDKLVITKEDCPYCRLQKEVKKLTDTLEYVRDELKYDDNYDIRHLVCEIQSTLEELK